MSKSSSKTAREFRQDLALKFAIEADDYKTLSEDNSLSTRERLYNAQRSLIFIKLAELEQNRKDNFDFDNGTEKAARAEAITKNFRAVV